MNQRRLEQRAIQQAGAGFGMLRADDIHVVHHVLLIGLAAFGHEGQMPDDDGLPVNITVAAVGLHHGCHVAVAALVNPRLLADFALQRQQRQLDAQVLDVQGFAPRRLGSVVYQFAAYQRGVGGADIDLGNELFHVSDGQPRRQGLAHLHSQALVADGQCDQVLQRQFGEAEGAGFDLPRHREYAPHNLAFDLDGQGVQAQVRSDGVVFDDLRLECVLSVLLDRRNAILVSFSRVQAVQCGQVFEVPRIKRPVRRGRPGEPVR